MLTAATILKKTFGFDSFRPGQEEVVASALAGEDVLAVMPTGSGKSLCYQLPAVVRGGLVLVVSPLIALMNDQVRQMRALGVAAYGLNSGQTPAENAAAWAALRSGAARLVYVAPERLLHEGTLATLGQYGVNCLVVDEAHCVSQWGHDFRPEYLQLRQAAKALGEPQILAFTATADQATRADVAGRLFARRPRVFIRGFDRPNIRLAMAAKDNARRQILDFVKKRKGQSGIVYCLSRKDTHEYADMLRQAGIDALPYHAGMDQMERRANQDRFQQDDGLVMTATIAFGMGIDKPDVRFVCHASLPKSIESYYQEIGRAGRDGLPADTLTLYGLDDIRIRKLQIQDSEATDEQKRVETQRLNALMALCETPRCRRQTLLAYFDETSGPCSNCDLCQDGCATEDGTIDAQKAMSAVVRTGQRFGTEHLVNLLVGKKTQAMENYGHHTLPTFGVGKDKTQDYWRALFRQIMALGLITLDIVNHGRWLMTERGWLVLRGQEKVEVRGGLGETKSQRRERTQRQRRAWTPPGYGRPDSALLAELKALRNSLARKADVPSYVVFPDKTLMDMDHRKPQTLAQMSTIFGVGDTKLVKYGQQFLEVIASHAAAPQAEEDPVDAPAAGVHAREDAPAKRRDSQGDAPAKKRGRSVDLEALKVIMRLALDGAASWEALKARLEAYDVLLREREGEGELALYRKSTGEYLAKASQAGFAYAKLIKRFGAGMEGHSHEWLAGKILGSSQEAD